MWAFHTTFCTQICIHFKSSWPESVVVTKARSSLVIWDHSWPMNSDELDTVFTCLSLATCVLDPWLLASEVRGVMTDWFQQMVSDCLRRSVASTPERSSSLPPLQKTLPDPSTFDSYYSAFNLAFLRKIVETMERIQLQDILQEIDLLKRYCLAFRHQVWHWDSTVFLIDPF